MLNNLYDMFKKWSYTDGTHKNAVYIFSDPHFNDNEMKALRKNYIGDKEQVKRINSKIGKNDAIIFLGDIGDLNFIKQIRGYKVLIMGNHEKGATNYKRDTGTIKATFQEADKEVVEMLDKQGFKTLDGYTYYKDYDNHLFDEVYEGPVMVNDRLILSHEPIEGLPKYMFNIHGHDHSNWFKSDHHMNVCAEHINYTPINLISLLKGGLLKNVESIHRITIDGATDRKKKRLKKAEEKHNEVCDDSNK